MYTSPMRMGRILKYDVGHVPNAVTYPDAYGVEIELEGLGIIHKSLDISIMWVSTEDGSLRKVKDGQPCQSIEYLFRYPYNLADTTKAIDLMFNHLTSPGVKVFESYRTSIHVHANCVMETHRTIYNFITLCLILDELLVSQNGEHRIGNNFCLRASDALGQVRGLMNSVENGNELYGIGGNERYSSINFASLTKFGTIEFRSLECTTHKGRLMHWINTIGQMKKSAKLFENPAHIIGLFSQMGPKQFLHHILGPYAMKYSPVPGFENMLHNGMRIAQDFAYCSMWTPKTNGRDNKE